MAKRITRNSYSDVQLAALREHEKIHGRGRHSAKLALKLASFRYPGAPKRTIGGLANRLNKLYKERIAVKQPKSDDTLDKLLDPIRKPKQELSFSGNIVDGVLEITFRTPITNLKSLM